MKRGTLLLVGPKQSYGFTFILRPYPGRYLSNPLHVFSTDTLVIFLTEVHKEGDFYYKVLLGDKVGFIHERQARELTSKEIRGLNETHP